VRFGSASARQVSSVQEFPEKTSNFSARKHNKLTSDRDEGEEKCRARPVRRAKEPCVCRPRRVFDGPIGHKGIIGDVSCAHRGNRHRRHSRSALEIGTVAADTEAYERKAQGPLSGELPEVRNFLPSNRLPEAAEGGVNADKAIGTPSAQGKIASQLLGNQLTIWIAAPSCAAQVSPARKPCRARQFTLASMRQAEAGPPPPAGATVNRPEEYLHPLLGGLLGYRRSRRRRVDWPGAGLMIARSTAGQLLQRGGSPR